MIDWNKASLVVDERHLLQVPHLMHSVPTHQLLAMRMHTQLLWEAYFSSLEKIVFTTFEVPESTTKLLYSAVYSERVDTLCSFYLLPILVTLGPAFSGYFSAHKKQLNEAETMY